MKGAKFFVLVSGVLLIGCSGQAQPSARYLEIAKMGVSGLDETPADQVEAQRLIEKGRCAASIDVEAAARRCGVVDPIRNHAMDGPEWTWIDLHKNTSKSVNCTLKAIGFPKTCLALRFQDESDVHRP